MRTAIVRLYQDVAQAIGANAQYAASTERTAGIVERAGIKQDKAWKLAETAGKRVAVGGALVLGAIGKANITFDKSMSNVNAATLETEANLGRLRKAAIDAGADTAYSAAEAADGITELAKAGVQTSDILGGALRGALDLAAAGQISVADAAEYTATALTQFQLKGNKAAHVADLLAAGAGKAQGEVADMALALNYAGVPSAQLGVSIEETAGTIALLAKNGLIGEKAGTALRGMLGSLTAPSKQAANLMGELGLEVFDAQGRFVGFDGVAGQLQKTMKGLTDDERAYYLGKIFGREQMQAANILLREGEDGVRKWTRAVDDQGFAAENAQRKMDNLAGDWERFTGELDSAFLNGGGGLQDGLRDIVQGAEKAVAAFNGLPDSVQEGTVKAVAALTGAGGIVWALSKVRSGVNGLRGGGALSRGVKLADAASAGRVVPVFVTNMAAAGLGAGGGDRAGVRSARNGRARTSSSGSRPSSGVPPVVGGGPVGGNDDERKSRRGRSSGRGAYVYEPIALAGPFLKGMDYLGSKLDDIGSRGKETGDKLLAGFEKPKGAGAKLLFGEGDTLQKDVDTALGALKFDGIFSGIERAGGSLIGGTSFTKSLDRVEELDAGLAKLYERDPSAAMQTFDRVLDKTGVSAAQLNRVLPETAAAIRGTGEGFNFMALKSVGVTPQLQAYGQVLKGLPKKVITDVAAKGTDLTRRDVRKLSQEYALTPRQVRTLMGLVGDGPTRQRLKAVQAQMAVTNALKAFPFIGQRGAEKTRGDVARVFSGVQTLGRAKATPRIAQQGAGDALSQMSAVSRSLAALNGRTATTYIRTIRTGISNSSLSPDVAADGGTVPDTGRGYADRHLYLLADREEVISDRLGQASSYRPVLKAINANRPRAQIKAMLAGGGTTGVVPGLADGGTVKATLSNGITIVFPAPAVTKAALTAAERIAVAAAKAARSNREQADADLEILRARQRIAELERSLNAKKKVGKGEKKRSVLELVGIDREVAVAELAQAKQELEDLRNLQTEIDTLTESRKATADAFSTVDIFSRGAAGSVSSVNRQITDMVTFNDVFARLKNAGASPRLLSQIAAKAREGDFRSANRLGMALLNQPLLLGQLNASLGVLDQVAGTTAQLATDPRLVGVGGAFGNVGQTVVQRNEVAVSLQTLDPSLITGELSRLVKFEVEQVVSKLAG